LVSFRKISGGNYVIRSLRVLLCIAVLASCALAQTKLNGAGATFPNPIYTKWFSEYHNLHSDIEINYQSIGSGGGIRQVQAGTVDFGATDGPMTDEQIAQSKVKVLHVPTVLGAVVPAYNIQGVSGDVKFTGDILADIYLGKLTRHEVPRLEHHGSASLGWQRHILHLYRLSF
jgi:phosphate transport system substrate-binding protein